MESLTNIISVTANFVTYVSKTRLKGFLAPKHNQKLINFSAIGSLKLMGAKSQTSWSKKGKEKG